jgi:hypothetical protein
MLSGQIKVEFKTPLEYPKGKNIVCNTCTVNNKYLIIYNLKGFLS